MPASRTLRSALGRAVVAAATVLSVLLTRGRAARLRCFAGHRHQPGLRRRRQHRRPVQQRLHRAVQSRHDRGRAHATGRSSTRRRGHDLAAHNHHRHAAARPVLPGPGGGRHDTSAPPALPTPDAIGTINMSATTGKVALVTNTTLLTCEHAAVCRMRPFATSSATAPARAASRAAAPRADAGQSTAELRASGGARRYRRQRGRLRGRHTHAAQPGRALGRRRARPFASPTARPTTCPSMATISLVFSEPVDVDGRLVRHHLRDQWRPRGHRQRRTDHVLARSRGGLRAQRVVHGARARQSGVRPGHHRSARPHGRRRDAHLLDGRPGRAAHPRHPGQRAPFAVRRRPRRRRARHRDRPAHQRLLLPGPEPPTATWRPPKASSSSRPRRRPWPSVMRSP